MVHTTLHKYLKLSKKFARWMTRLLDQKMKKELVRTCEVFRAIITTVF
jgi:hypothetical protein